MVINKIYVIIVAIIVVVVAVGGIIALDRNHSSGILSNPPGGSGGSNKISPGTLTVKVDKTINDQAFDNYMIQLCQNGGVHSGFYTMAKNKTKMLYNLTISYSGVGTAFFSIASIEVHTTQGIANSTSIIFYGATGLINKGAFIYLNNSQNISGQIGACYNSTATATSITVQSGVSFNNLADGDMYHSQICAQTTTIPSVSSYLSVLNNPFNSGFYYPEVMLDGNQTDCKITGFSPANGVSAIPENFSDPFSSENGSVLYIYTGQVISETLKIEDSSATTYFKLTGVSGNITVNAGNLPQSTENNGYFYITVYITGPDSAFSGPLVINLTGSFVQN